MMQDTAPPVERRRSDFAPLIREVEEHGLLQRRALRYGAGIGVDWLLGALLVIVMILVGDSWWQVPAAFSARSSAR